MTTTEVEVGGYFASFSAEEEEAAICKRKNNRWAEQARLKGSAAERLTNGPPNHDPPQEHAVQGCNGAALFYQIRKGGGMVRQRMAEAYKLPPVLCDALYALYTADVVPPRGVVTAVTMFRLRKDLKPYGIEVKSRRRVGYWLPDEHRQAIEQVVTAA